MKKLILFLAIVFAASVSFGQAGSFGNLQTKNIRIGGRTIYGFDNDSALAVHDSISLPTAYAVYNYFTNHIAPVYVSSSFDTTTRVLTLTRIDGTSTSVVIPAGAASGATGMTALSNSRSVNEITVAGDNGNATSFSISDDDSATRVHTTDSNTVFVTPYRSGLKAPLTDTLNQNRLPYWKKWVIFGDSFSATPSRYYGRVDTLLNLTGTVTNGVSGNRFYQQSAILDSILAANPTYFNSFNIASILLGVNDFAASDSLGTINDSSNRATCAGYLKHMIESILGANPNIELYVMTPTEANGAGVLYHSTNSAGWTLTDLEVLISTICSKYGVQCIDLHSLANFNLKTIPSLTSDGLHPNYYGSIVLGNIIAQAFAGHNNKGTVANGSFQAATSNGNSTIDSVRIGSSGTPKSTLDLNAATPILTLTASNTSKSYGIQFNVDGSIKQTASTGELQINVGRNSTWGGFITFYADASERARINKTGLGIGKTPVYPLDVIGRGNFAGGADVSVSATSTSGNAITANSTSGLGVVGSSSSNIGVYGSSSNSVGVQGISSSNVGVYGTSTDGIGVQANSTNNLALFAASINNYGAEIVQNGTLTSANSSSSLYIGRTGVTNSTGALNYTGDVLKIFDSPTGTGTVLGAEISAIVDGTERFRIDPRVSDCSSCVAGFIDTKIPLTAINSKLFTWRNNGVDKVWINYDGKIRYASNPTFLPVDSNAVVNKKYADSIHALSVAKTTTINGKALSSNQVIGYPDIAAGAIVNNTTAITQATSDSTNKLETTAGAKQKDAVLAALIRGKADTGTVHIITTGGIIMDTTSNPGNITLRLDSAYIKDSIMGATTASSGTYTPTLTNTSNITSSTLISATYQKIGNIVSVRVAYSVTPTVGGSLSALTISLPFTTATATQDDAGSGSYTNGGTTLYSSVVGVNSTTTAVIDMYPASTSTVGGSVTFQYAL